MAANGEKPFREVPVESTRFLGEKFYKRVLHNISGAIRIPHKPGCIPSERKLIFRHR